MRNDNTRGSYMRKYGILILKHHSLISSVKKILKLYGQITSMEEAKAIIEAMRLRCQCRGRQIMAYRKKLHQQVLTCS